MTMQPRDIVVWAQYRSASTSMCYRLVYGIRRLGQTIPNQAVARFIGEGTGLAGLVGPGWRSMGQEITQHLDNRVNNVASTETVSMSYGTWHLDEQGYLGRREAFGDPWDEIQNRMQIMRDGLWTNPVVFKHMGWPRLRVLQQQTTDCILNSRKELYHVCTWRANLFDWMCSHYSIRKRHDHNFQPHGTFEWNGEPFRIIRPEVKRNFLAASARILDNFCDLIQHMPRDRSVMVELKDINGVERMIWPNGAQLVMPTTNQMMQSEFRNKAMGENVYLYQGQRIRAADMIDIDLLETFRDWAQTQQQRLDWNNLPTRMGIKTQPG